MEKNTARRIKMIRQVVVHDVVVESITTGMHRTVDEHNIANLQASYFCFSNRRLQNNLFSGKRHTLAFCHAFDFVRLPVLPMLNSTCRRVKQHAKAAVGPAP